MIFEKPNREQIMILLRSLDVVARNIDQYSYGLPVEVDDDSDAAALREVVSDWLYDLYLSSLKRL